MGALQAHPPKVNFTENKGQWPQQVLFRALIPGGAVFVERSALTYVLFADSPLQYHGHPTPPDQVSDPGRAHAYRVHFEGGQAIGSTTDLRQPHYENYFTGNDPDAWGTGCAVFGEVTLKNVWPGIDLRMDGREGLKYDLIVAPGADPATIRFRYEGQDALGLERGRLRIALTTGDLFEEAPVSYLVTKDASIDNEHGRLVPSSYVLDGNVLRFNVIGDSTETLVIDPILTFASYSGSTADNFGCTASYDDAGHLYGGGIAFQAGYPVTVGVLQNFWAGGSVDVAISKWSSNGSSLIWSTYLGGTGAESPHSLVVNANEELFVMGSTGSSNFPVTASAFDNSFNGGGGPIVWTNLSFGNYGFNHNNGTDIFVAHFNAAATALIGSTYIGGSGPDGLNNTTTLTHNYGDHFRGEIALDPMGNPTVATTTRSPDMPLSAGAPQPALNGSMDGYCFKLDPLLSTLLWGTYLGGSGDDNGLGLQFDSAGEIFVCGGTTSSDLPMAGTPFDNSFGGVSDGYLVRYNAAGNALLSSTYVGTNAYDQTYFVQLNTADEVFTVGQTLGSYPTTPGKYANPSSPQFVHKFSHDLSTSLWSTRLGNGNNNQALSPTAFLVSDCGQIYLSGWAGSTNGHAGNSNSTTTGSPVTTDAFQATTDGSDFYLMMLEPEATALNYATFFGGPTSAEHVDGGTSRFDKDGTVYQAVCAGCGNHDDFPTTPGAWSNTNNSFNCNLGVFKFSLAQAQAVIGISGPSSMCTSGTAQFTNSSQGGTDQSWDFGDGSVASTAFAPSHTYTTPGTFTVTMILTDSSTCISADTATIVLTIIPPPTAVIQPIAPICPGGNVHLIASGGTSYLWAPATGLSSTSVAGPFASPDTTTVYSVIVTGQCGSDTANIEVEVRTFPQVAVPDTSTCLGDGVLLATSGGGSYAWTPATGLDDPMSATPTATPDTTTIYLLTVTTPEGCLVTDLVTVLVFDIAPDPVLTDTVLCVGTSVQLIADMADEYTWHSANGIAVLDIRDPIVSPTEPTLYIVDLVSPCGTLTDSAFVDVIGSLAQAWPDTLVCPGQAVELFATGGISFRWTPSTGLDSDTIPNPIATPPTSTTYMVSVTEEHGCTDTAQVSVELHPWPVIIAGWDRIIDLGDIVELTATGDGLLHWTPNTWLDDSLSASPLARPEASTVYTVTITDSLGCTNTDKLSIILTGTLFIPNAFTPNGDGYNDGFGAWASELSTFELMLFNRWGELIWSTTALDDRWDGTYKGVQSPIGVYVWTVRAIELSGRERHAIGHVSLLR